MLDPLHYDFMVNAYLAATIVAIAASLVGFFVVLRGLAFAGHALSHVGFAGAAGAVLLGLPPLVGLLVFSLGSALAMGALGERLRGRDVAIGIVLAFALGLGVLFLSLYTGYAGEAISILFGTILGVSAHDVVVTALLSLLVLVGLAALFRPLLFSSVAEDVAIARGLPVRVISATFLMLVAIAVSVAVQVVGVLLIFTLLVAPPATAMFLTRSVPSGLLLSALIAVLEAWVGITLAFYTPLPVSFYIALLAIAAYSLARLSAYWAQAGRARPVATPTSPLP